MQWTTHGRAGAGVQPLNWYLHRIGGMSPREIAWRLQSGIRDSIDRVRIPLGLVPGLRNSGSPQAPVSPRGFQTTSVAHGAWSGIPEDPQISRWAERLRSRADDVAANRLSFFNLEKHYAGNPIDWHLDHECGKAAPLRLSQGIDYRDYRVTGDAKMVWEPNRHHHLVVLGRAFRAFGEPRYAEAATRQLHSWIESNPFGYGMNWRSPLELGIRVINWVWALDLMAGHDGTPRTFKDKVRDSAWRHLWEITRKYSRGSSSNNHLVGEAAGVFIGSAYFNDLPESRNWLDESHGILSREILRQTYRSGCTREQALGYHLFVLQFFIIAGIVGRRIGMEFPPECWERIRKMIEFAAAIAEGGPSPLFGDCDDGYVLDLAGGGNDPADLFAIGAVLFDSPDFKALAGEFGEAGYWLLDPGARKRFDDIPVMDVPAGMRSRAFQDSGHYLLQSGHSGMDDGISLLFDCAELGFTSIAAHGHADALSFTLRVAGREVFVDPGTFDYFTYPEWRSYFRSTRAHNTVEIDGRDQSEMLGPFLWGRRAETKCVRFETNGQGGKVCGEHDGYSSLHDPVLHIRSIELDGDEGAVKIADEIRCKGTHDVRVFFHVARDCEVCQDGNHRLLIETGGSTVILDVDTALEVTLLTGSVAPIGGWFSDGYHRKCHATTISLKGKSSGPTVFRFEMRRIMKDS